MSSDKPTLLIVKFPYKPCNNDELRLVKGDIITLTQKEEGGWWEGTLDGRTGWFPSNYVTEYIMPTLGGSPDSIEQQSQSPSSSIYASPIKQGNTQQSVVTDSPAKKLTQVDGSTSSNTNSQISLQSSNSRVTITNEERIQYRRMILTDLIESETTHISDIQSTWENILQPLPKAGILTSTEYKALIGSLPEVIQVLTTCILNPVKTEQCKPAKDQRIGKIFLDNALKIEAVLKNYCSNHPRAVQIIDKQKEQLDIFVENKLQNIKSVNSNGILHLISILSQPFRRLEKYPSFLMELERNVEEFHKDRGDLQRSIEYYKQLDKSCAELRKQKEMELEVLRGSIIGWEGSDVSLLGDIMHMNLVHIGPEKEPRYFVLFTNTLLILSYDLEKNSLKYEGKIPISGITLTQINANGEEINSNAFEIAGPMIDPISVNCVSKQAKESWINHINKILKANRFPSVGSSPQQSFGHLSAPIQAWTISRLRPAPPFNPFLNECLAIATAAASKNNTNDNSNRNSSNSTTAAAAAAAANANAINNVMNGKHRGKSQSPTQSSLITTSSSASYYISTYPQLTNEEDFTLLSIVDSFCNKNRQTSCASANINLPSGKCVNVNGNGNSSKIPRTLAEHVYSLRDEIIGLKSNVSSLKSQLIDEQNARKNLQSMVHSLLVQNRSSSTTNGMMNNNASSSSSSSTNHVPIIVPNNQSQSMPMPAAAGTEAVISGSSGSAAVNSTD